jgi:hypothetical protein
MTTRVKKPAARSSIGAIIMALGASVPAAILSAIGTAFLLISVGPQLFRPLFARLPGGSGLGWGIGMLFIPTKYSAAAGPFATAFLLVYLRILIYLRLMNQMLLTGWWRGLRLGVLVSSLSALVITTVYFFLSFGL